jgi:hypothetical protein
MTTEIYERFIKFANMKGSLPLDVEQDLLLAPTQSLALSVGGSQSNDSVGPIGMIPEKKWEGPIIVSDLCCKDRKCFEEGGFKDFTMLGDVYHITKRIIDTLCKDSFTVFCMCIKDLRSCFGSDELGVFWDSEKIILQIEALKDVYIPTGTWTPATTTKFEIEKYHIVNCLHFPKVSIAIKIFLFVLLYYR